MAETLSNRERLIIFTRYPEPGSTKTRLIPALGAEGAAQVHRQMTEYTLAQLHSLIRSPAIDVEIRYTGGDRCLMQDWLGPDISYHPQGGGDLGERLTRAFQDAFAQGAERVVTIGTDCPDVDGWRVQRALHLLEQQDLVLGRATDGGYYLIGLRSGIPDLFTDIAWGTAAVLQQTVAVAQALNLSVGYLDALSDVDYPADLALWEAAQTCTVRPQTISVIIPVLNEAARLREILVALQSVPFLEILVVDGGSQDQTIAIAQSCGVTVVSGTTGRARQMNAGAQVAFGNILLFLHADTRLPPDFAPLIRQTLAQEGTVAGAFDLKIDSPLAGLRWVEWGVKWRSRLCQLPYGDQAIFLTAETFKQVGGFPDLPIMEDFELMRRLRRLGRVAIAPATVLTSARRWEKLGIWQTTLLNQRIIIAYLMGVSPARLVCWYRGTIK